MSLQKLLLMGILSVSAVAEQMVYMDWAIQNEPATGLQDVSFPISMPYAPHESGYYFEQAVGFKEVGDSNGGSDCLYTGLQPRPDSNGNSIVHAVFSSFLKGSTTTDSNCHPGSDNNSFGVSCAIEVPASYEISYVLKISKLGDHTYVGSLLDDATGRGWHIGTIDVPLSVNGMTQKYGGFIEYYYTGLGDCSAAPQTRAAFGIPRTSTPGVSLTQGAPYENSDCAGKFPFSYKITSNGAYDISVGG